MAKAILETITSEFNIHTDPEAAHMVFSAWPMLTLLSWETTLAHIFSRDVLDRFFNWHVPRKISFMISTRRPELYQEKSPQTGCVFAGMELVSALRSNRK